MDEDARFASLGRAEDTLWQLLAALRDGGGPEDYPHGRGCYPAAVEAAQQPQLFGASAQRQHSPSAVQAAAARGPGGRPQSGGSLWGTSVASGSALPSCRSGGPGVLHTPSDQTGPSARRPTSSLHPDRDLDEGVPAFAASATIGMGTQDALLQTLQGLHSRLCVMMRASDLPADPRLKAQLQDAAARLGQLVTYVGGLEQPAPQPPGQHGPEAALREELDRCQAELRRRAAELREREDECEELRRELASARRQLLSNQEGAAMASVMPSPLALPQLQSATAGTGATDSLPGSAVADDPCGLRAQDRWREPDEKNRTKARHQQALPAVDALSA